MEEENIKKCPRITLEHNKSDFCFLNPTSYQMAGKELRKKWIHSYSSHEW